MAEGYGATNLENTKGRDEFLEVEDLIKQTLAETKLEEAKKAPPPPPAPLPKPAAKELASTVISKPVQAAQPPAQTVAEKYADTFKEYQVGDIVKGQVLKVDQGGILVDIKYKADGIVPPEEIEGTVKVGEIINVMIDNLENKEGYVVLSKSRADQETRWRFAFDAYKKRTVLEGKVTQVLRGGLAVDCDGLRGFVPASQVAKKPEESLDQFKDQVIPLRVIEINHRQGKIVMSHKQAAGAPRTVDTDKLFNELAAGQVRRGKVANLKPFGAFVDLGGVEGLIHLSELSWKRVNHPSAVLKTGQEIDVFVLGVDKVNKKISLGLKELLPDPWEKATEYFKQGQIVKAKVLRFAKFGAFVELDHDLEGLIHNTELGLDPVFNPADAVKIGDVVEVKILRVLPEEQKIGLSIRAALAQKEKAAAALDDKVTIGDLIAHKEKVQADKESEEAAAAEDEI